MIRSVATLLFAIGATAGCSPADDSESVSVRSASTVAEPERWEVGRVATAEEVAAWDLDVNARGMGLPAGSGTHAEGARIFASKCAVCHGVRGEGMRQGSVSMPRLIGREPRDGFPFGKDLAHVKTVGNYWPYATTVYDYMRRTMPLNAPGSLTADELYALTAFLLAENDIITRETEMNARTLPAVRMPARDRFVPDDRPADASDR